MAEAVSHQHQNPLKVLLAELTAVVVVSHLSQHQVVAVVVSHPSRHQMENSQVEAKFYPASLFLLVLEATLGAYLPQTFLTPSNNIHCSK